MRNPGLRCVLGCLLLLATACKEVIPKVLLSDPPKDFATCQGDSFQLDLLSALDALPEDTPAAHQEQIRDWIWTTLLSRISAQQSDPELLAGTIRQPLLRDEAFSHILDIPVGRSRAITAKDGTTYVFVDRSSDLRTYEDVLEAIDQESLVQGEIPPKAVVYGADIQWDKARAEVCQLATVDRAWIKSPEQGFRSMEISDDEDLKKFLKGGVDLLSASTPDEDTLEVTGRVRTRAARAPVTTEDVAALSRTGEGGDDLGFSLDPRTDLAQALESVDQLNASLASPASFDAMLREWQVPSDQALPLRFAFRLNPEPTRASLASLRETLAASDPSDAEAALMESPLGQEDPLSAELIQQVLRRSAYQCARYDGPMTGTLPAMTMFYTDLVAKLWAIDWQRCSPTGSVPGFVSIPEYRDSLAYCGRDEGVPFTRIWFGARQEGFVRDSDSALRFSPVATRLFALGSALGSEHSEEVEPAARMLRFIRWWDRNYSQVATWEPQYELLNQLVKWTLVRRMAEASSSSLPAFLDEVPVDQGQRFDTWLAAQKDLRLKNPVPLIAKTGETTECLNLFDSAPFEQCDRVGWLSGGIGLPTLDEVSGRTVRNSDPSRALRHIDPEAPAQRTPEGGFHWDTVARAKGTINNLEASITPEGMRGGGRIESDIPLRGGRGFYDGVTGVDFTKVHLITGDSARVEQQIEKFGALRLDMDKLLSDAPRLTVIPDVRLQAEQLAYHASDRVLRGDDLVSAVHFLAPDLPAYRIGDDRVAVALKATRDAEPTYAVLTMASGGGNNGPPLPPGTRFIAGAPEPPDSGGAGEGILFVLVRKEDAEVYFKQENARAIAPDGVVRQVEASLAGGKIKEALETVQASAASSRAVAEVAVDAVARRDLKLAESLISRLREGDSSPADFERVENALGHLYAVLGREGRKEAERKQVSRLTMQVGMAHRKMSPPEAQRLLDSNGGTIRAMYRSQGFNEESMPPVAFTPGVPLPPNKRYVVEVFDVAVRAGELPDRLGGGGGGLPPIDFTRFDRNPKPSPEILRSARRPYLAGSAYHLVSGGACDANDPEDEDCQTVWPLVMVTPCSIEGDGQLPSCYRSTEAGAMPMGVADILRKSMEASLACDEDGDGNMTEEEAACVERVSEELAAKMGQSAGG